MTFNNIERTRYVTVFREQETGRKLWRSGRFIGTLTIEEGQRPFPDRDAYYDPVRIDEQKHTKSGEDAVFQTVEDEEKS